MLSALSHQANLIGDLTVARDVARAARQAALQSGSHTLQAQFAAMEARALASLGDRTRTLRALGEAEEYFAARDPARDPAWISYFDDGELAAEAAHCHLALDDFERAATALAPTTATISAEMARSNAFANIVLIESLIGAGEFDHAAAIAARVLPACASVGSARIDVYLARLRSRIDSAKSSKSSSPLEALSAGLDQVQATRARRWPVA